MAIARDGGRGVLRVVKGKSGAGDPLPPCNLEAERNLLGSIVIDPQQISVCSHLTAHDFYTPEHAVVFEALQELADANRLIDLVTLDEQLRRTGRLTAAGGQVAVSELTSNVVNTFRAGEYARIVFDLACERETMQAAADIAAAAYATQGDIGGVLASAQARLATIAARHVAADAEDASDGAHGGDEDGERPTEQAALHDLVTEETFPLDTLPKAMRNLVKAASYAIPCSPDLVALPVLVAAASAIGNSWAMHVKRGYIEPPIFYAAIVARPGDGKSPAVGYAMRPIYESQEREIISYRAKLDEWEQSKAEEHAGDHPRLTQHFTTDTTIEALADTLHDARSIVVVKDELHAWVVGMDAYKAKGRGSERDAWLSLWRAAAVMINRRNREGALYLHAPHVNVIGGIQEDRLPDLDDDQGRADGFLDRVLFAYPRPGELRYSEAEVDEETAHIYAQLIDDLYTYPLAIDGEGKTATNYAHFTPEGKEEYRRWCETFYAEMNALSFPMLLRGPWVKLQTYAVRLALVLHLCRSFSHEPGDQIRRGEVDGVDVVNAVTVIEYFKRQTRKVHARLHAQPEDLRLLGALEWIHRQPEGRATARDILRFHVASVRNAEEAKALLDDLAARGYGEAHEVKQAHGRPAYVFTLRKEGRQ